MAIREGQNEFREKLYKEHRQTFKGLAFFCPMTLEGLGRSYDDPSPKVDAHHHFQFKIYEDHRVSSGIFVVKQTHKDIHHDAHLLTGVDDPVLEVTRRYASMFFDYHDTNNDLVHDIYINGYPFIDVWHRHFVSKALMPEVFHLGGVSFFNLERIA
jgi:hypothetical protein